MTILNAPAALGRDGAAIPFPVGIFTIPKTGTHLCRRLLELLGVAMAENALWKLTTMTFDPPAPGESTIRGLAPGRAIPTGVLRQFMSGVARGQYTPGHPRHGVVFADMLRELGFRVIACARDPRDWACSHADWLVDPMAPDAARREYFRASPFGDRLMLSLTGGPLEPGAAIAPMAEHFESYLQWHHESFVLAVRYEDLVGPRGGGSAEAQLATIERIIRHIGGDPAGVDMKNVADQVYGGTRTFRHGRIGRWRELFEPRHVEACKRHGGRLLVEMGYEPDGDWNVTPR